MNNEHEQDWDPRSEEARRDQRRAYDAMRRRCPVAHSDFFGWTLFRHADVMRALKDHESFSNAVSQHLTVPNGMDPPEHTEYRRIIEPYFSQARMTAFEPTCRKLAQQCLNDFTRGVEVEFMASVALPYAVRVQCAFLGWPENLYDILIDWISRNQRATLAQDRKVLSQIAAEFEYIIDDLLDSRRASNAPASQDITASLMHEKVWGRPLTNEEVASILRNWTAGEIGTISAAVGILVQYLAEHPELQNQLRSEQKLLPYAIDEVLRIHGPLVANRRVTTKPVEIGGIEIGANERISHKLGFREPRRNLFLRRPTNFASPATSLELRAFMEELLAASKTIALVSEKRPSLAIYPASGFSSIAIRIT